MSSKKVELADIFRQYRPAYLEKYGERMLPSHKRAMQDIIDCRTEELGGQVYFCQPCDDYRYSYHSCKNRNCNKCGNDQATEWLKQQRHRLLPVTHFLVTFTLHDHLRQLARSNQKIIYHLLFQASAAALQKLARDPKFVGGELAMMGVLQTWTRDLLFHPHVHYVVPGGGLSADGSQWLSARNNFLVPVKALSKIFRAKFRDALKKTELFKRVPPQTWKQAWVVHSEAVGSGEKALEYLAKYIFRIALSNKRLVKLEDGKVTFQYQHAKTGQTKTKTLPALEFMHDFLQHVLPLRFVKVRYYGLWSPTKRELLEKAQALLGVKLTKAERKPQAELGEATDNSEPPKLCCPKCGHLMRWVKELPSKRKGRSPPC